MSQLASQICDSMSSGALAVSLDGQVLFLNRVLARRLKVNPEQWQGRPAADLVKEVELRMGAQEGLRRWLEVPHDPGETATRELEFRDPEQFIALREDSGPLRDESGAVIGRLFLYHDISREKSIDRMKSEFISVASHELRTPMTSIKGSIDLILSGFAGDIGAEVQELLEIAHKSCDRLIRLINDILDIAKIESGQVKMNLVAIDLTDAVERSMRSVKPLADQAGVRLALERPETLPLVEVDKDRIEQVVTNLLSNAIKFSPEDSEVRITVHGHDGWLFCSVVDQGCGMSESDLKKIFGKFQQVGDRRRGGTGLGLAISQALIHEHHGAIWVESQVNVGSKFTFKLPAYVPTAEELAEQAQEAGASADARSASAGS